MDGWVIGVDSAIQVDGFERSLWFCGRRWVQIGLEVENGLEV